MIFPTKASITFLLTTLSLLPYSYAAPSLPKTVAAAPQPALALTAHGTQNYVCDTSQRKWLLIGADAPLYDEDGQEVGTHFFVDAKPHWRLHHDSSFIATSTLFPIPSPHAPHAIPWLVAEKSMTSDSGFMSEIKYVARVDTSAGVAPNDGECWEHGAEVRSEYWAKYLFVK